MKAKTTAQTVDLILPFDLAEKVFGLYVHGAKEKVDLSMFKAWMSFAHEITVRLKALSKEDQSIVQEKLTESLRGVK